MSRYDAVIVGAGLGGLTAGAILSRAGLKVLVIERSNSVGGAASSYKVGDLFVEGSLHETGNPHDPRDPKHDPLTRAGVLDAVTWVPSGTFYTARGGPLGAAFTLPDNFEQARTALTQRFPQTQDAIVRVLAEMEAIADGTPPQPQDWTLSLSEKFAREFGDNEPLKAALAANLSYYHGDPATMAWTAFAQSQGGYLLSGARYIQGGSQRLSSALARAIKAAGSDVILRRTVSGIDVDVQGRVTSVTHTAKDGSDPKTVDAARVIGNAAPDMLADLLPAASGDALRKSYADRTPSISLFALTLGLSQPPRAFGIASYSTQLLPDWMSTFSDYAQATALMADEPGEQMPPLSIVDYAAIESGVPAPPYVLSVVGPDALSNWIDDDQDAYRAKRGRWQVALVTYLDRHFPGLAASVTASAFNTAFSVRQYLAAPHGSVYGFAPVTARSAHAKTSATPIPGLYLASAYAGSGGYTGVIQSAGICADMILNDR